MLRKVQKGYSSEIKPAEAAGRGGEIFERGGGRRGGGGGGGGCGGGGGGCGGGGS